MYKFEIISNERIYPFIRRIYETMQHLKSQLTEKYELVALEQSSAGVRKNQVRDAVDQTGDAFTEGVGWFREFNGILKDRAERLERKLVQHVDLVEIVKDEVEEAGPGCHRPVGLSRLVYLGSGHLRLDSLRLDLARGLLRSFEVLHKSDVAQDVGSRRR